MTKRPGLPALAVMAFGMMLAEAVEGAIDVIVGVGKVTAKDSGTLPSL